MSLFFGDSGPAVHIAPGGVFHLGSFVITNSIFYGWICSVLLIVTLIWVARRITIRPKGGLIQYIEIGADFITGLVVNAFDDKKKGRKYVPYFVTLFFFILVNNWLGLIPGVGEAIHVGGLPLLRPFTGDLDGTLAMGLITMTVVYVSSIRESGSFRNYLRHFFVGNPANPLYLLIGLLEMFTDMTRVFSLSLRLFLNVAIGEIIIAVFSYLGHVLAPATALPFTLLEFFVGALQAYIFCILSIMYLAIAVNHAHHDLTEEDVPATIGMEPETNE